MDVSLFRIFNPTLYFLHPILMWGLLGLYFYASYLGIQSRSIRSAKGEEKKKLVKGKFPVLHHQISSIWLGLMVIGSMVGIAVTYINYSKLFVAPHLLVGLLITVLVVLSAALAPFMHKGNEWARYTHIGINILVLVLFIWEAVTGTQIVQQILSSI
jgi:hypothetical protein